MSQLICTLSFDPADEENDWAENSLLSIRNNVSASGTSFAVEKKEKKERKKMDKKNIYSILMFSCWVAYSLYQGVGVGVGVEQNIVFTGYQ